LIPAVICSLESFHSFAGFSLAFVRIVVSGEVICEGVLDAKDKIPLLLECCK